VDRHTQSQLQTNTQTRTHTQMLAYLQYEYTLIHLFQVYTCVFILFLYINVYREIRYFLSFVYFFVGWRASAVSMPRGDVIFAQLTCPLSNVKFCLHSELVAHLSINIDIYI
jgi:hypothetical protein